jgi:hypothetical protein
MKKKKSKVKFYLGMILSALLCAIIIFSMYYSTSFLLFVPNPVLNNHKIWACLVIYNGWFMFAIGMLTYVIFKRFKKK